MIEFYTKRNIFDSGADALVNPVNCAGAMGAGLAKQFAERFPAMVRSYRNACKTGKLRPGGIHVFRAGAVTILNLATKNHWKDESKLEWVDQGLMDLADIIEELGLESVAVPALGCGYGRLKWEDVKYLIETHLGDIDDCKIMVFEPNVEKYSARRARGPLRNNPTKRGEPTPFRGITINE